MLCLWFSSLVEQNYRRIELGLLMIVFFFSKCIATCWFLYFLGRGPSLFRVPPSASSPKSISRLYLGCVKFTYPRNEEKTVHAYSLYIAVSALGGRTRVLYACML